MAGLYTDLQAVLMGNNNLPIERVNRGSFEKRQQNPLPVYPCIFIDDFFELTKIENTIQTQTQVVTRVRCFSQIDAEAFQCALDLLKLNGECFDPFKNFLVETLNATVHPDGVFEYSYNFTIDLQL